MHKKDELPKKPKAYLADKSIALNEAERLRDQSQRGVTALWGLRYANGLTVLPGACRALYGIDMGDEAGNLLFRAVGVLILSGAVLKIDEKIAEKLDYKNDENIVGKDLAKTASKSKDNRVLIPEDTDKQVKYYNKTKTPKFNIKRDNTFRYLRRGTVAFSGSILLVTSATNEWAQDRFGDFFQQRTEIGQAIKPKKPKLSHKVP